jgi:hypothetical protein
VSSTNAQLGTYCGFQAPAAFDTIGRLTGTSVAGVARGSGADVVKEPSLSDSADEVPSPARGKGGKSFRATVDVYFHVVSDGATGNVSDSAVRDQIQVMNMGFGGFEGGFATGIGFKLVSIDRSDNAEWYDAGPGTSAEREMKKALHKGDAGDLNVYSTTAGPYLGWA